MSENPIDSGMMILGAVGAYLVWCAIQYSKTKVWSWAPWKTPVARLKPHVVNSIAPSNHNAALETITLIVP